MGVILREVTRKLRKKSTLCEEKLWKALRNRQLLGFKFVRQHPVVVTFEGRRRIFVTDFYCHVGNFAIEVDGPIHDSQQERDQLRELIISDLGIKILRFKNQEIQKNFNQVLQTIKTVLGPLLSREKGPL